MVVLGILRVRATIRGGSAWCEGVVSLATTGVVVPGLLRVRATIRGGSAWSEGVARWATTGVVVLGILRVRTTYPRWECVVRSRSEMSNNRDGCAWSLTRSHHVSAVEVRGGSAWCEGVGR